MKATRQLRDLLARDRTLIAPGCFDPLTARIIEKLGFEACYLGGYSAGAQSCITEPMFGLSDMVGLARSIANSVKIPLIVDAGAGFGDPAYVVRTVKEFEKAGVAGIHIEDQVYPKRFHYHRYSVSDPTRPLHTIPTELMVKKLEFGLKAREDTDFVIIARTDSIASHSLDEAIARGVEYTKAGADMFMCFPGSVEDIKKVSKSVNAPLLLLNGEARPRPYLTTGEAQELGIKTVIYSLTATYLATNAIWDTYELLKTRGTTELNSAPLTAKMERAKRLVEDLIGLPELYNMEEQSGYR